MNPSSIPRKPKIPRSIINTLLTNRDSWKGCAHGAIGQGGRAGGVVRGSWKHLAPCQTHYSLMYTSLRIKVQCHFLIALWCKFTRKQEKIYSEL